MLDFIIISNVGLFTILPRPASFSWKLKYYVIEYGFSLLYSASTRREKLNLENLNMVKSEKNQKNNQNVSEFESTD